MDARHTMLCWNPDSNEVDLVAHPDLCGASDKYMMTALGCWSRFNEMNFEQRKAVIFIEAMHLIIRDGCDPDAVHRALLALDEYRDGLAGDMPGLTN